MLLITSLTTQNGFVNTEEKNHVCGKRWTKNSSWRFLRDQFIWRKVTHPWPWVEVSPTYSSYPGWAFSYISLQNVANCLHDLHVIGNGLKLACSARRVTRLAGPPVWIGLVTLPAGQTFLHKLTRVNISDEDENRRSRLTALSPICSCGT